MKIAPLAAPMGIPISTIDRPPPGDEAFPQPGDKRRDVLTFSVGGEEYALGIVSIREIIKCRPITEVPRVPSFVAGIIAVRGVVMPVIDLRLRLRLPALPLQPKARILVVMRPHAEGPGQQDGAPEPFGLIVDRVHHVVQLSEYDIEPPTMLGGHESDFVSGIGRLPGAAGHADGGEQRPRGSAGTGVIPSQKRPMLILLDLGRVLSFEHAGSDKSGGHHLQPAPADARAGMSLAGRGGPL